MAEKQTIPPSYNSAAHLSNRKATFFLCQLTCARDLLSVLFLALPVIFFCHLVFSKMSSISISPFVFPSKHRHWTKVNLANELNLLHLVIQSPLLSPLSGDGFLIALSVSPLNDSKGCSTSFKRHLTAITKKTGQKGLNKQLPSEVYQCFNLLSLFLLLAKQTALKRTTTAVSCQLPPQDGRQ